MVKSAATWEGRRALTDNPATSPETYQTAARQMLALDLPSEAAVFFALAGDEEGLGEVLDRAAAEGNFFIFQAAASRRRDKTIDRQLVQTLAAAAEKNGRALDGARAAAWLKEN